MAIISSVLLEDRAQIDGRMMRHEQHTDNYWTVIDVFYLGEPGSNGVTIMQARVADLNQQLADAELAANLAEAYA